MSNKLFRINVNSVDSQNIQNIISAVGVGGAGRSSSDKPYLLNITSQIQTFTLTNIREGIIFSIENSNYITQSIITVIIPYIESNTAISFKIVNSTIDANVTIYTSGDQMMHSSLFIPPFGSTSIVNNTKTMIEFIYVKPNIYLLF
jgi:hypothetical protein